MNAAQLSTTGGDVIEEGDPLVSVPRPRWRTFTRIIQFGSMSLFFFAMAFVVLGSLKNDSDMSTGHRVLLFALFALFCVDALLHLFLLRLSLKLPLEIFRSGIAFQGMKMSWETDEGCRWARYAPGTLELRTHRSRLYFPISREQRAAVEATLRDLGKWQC